MSTEVELDSDLRRLFRSLLGEAAPPSDLDDVIVPISRQGREAPIAGTERGIARRMRGACARRAVSVGRLARESTTEHGYEGGHDDAAGK